jgi:hypothetical protein
MGSPISTTEHNDSQPIESNTQAQSITDACSTMKDEIKDESERMVADSQSKGKPKSLTDACSDMKDAMVVEAERLVPNRDRKTSN